MARALRFAVWSAISLAVAGCAPLPEASRAVSWELQPDARTVVTVEGRRFTVLTFENVYIENGVCFPEGGCVTYFFEPTLTEVIAQSTPELEISDEEIALAAGLLARCPGADPLDEPDQRDDQTGFSGGVWTFDSLCPQDRENEG